MALLSAFNPHEFSEQTVRTVATGREDALAQIVRTAHGNIGAESIQHLIVSAPRGYGKSFMMRHVQFELVRIAQDEQLPLRTVLMPEEMPHVREPESLLTELARGIEGGAGGDADLTWHEDEGELWVAATARLETAIAAAVGSGGLVVALVENFDALIKRAFAKDIQSTRLRELLTRRDSQLMLISASATGAFDRNYDKPLFQAFAEIKLEPWTVDECLIFFARQRIAAGKPPLTPTAEARARAVSEFIGGTPRLATLLGDALLDDDVIGAAELLHKLVDELTPYYKERIEALPGRSQKLLDALLRFGEPASQTEIARRVSASGQSAIAGPFRDLIAERIIIGEKAPGSAERLYRVADRVFAHYYRRRVVQHGQSTCPLEALVDLLAVYFSPDEKKEKIDSFAKAGRMAEARVMARLYQADVGADQDNWWLHELRDYDIPKRLIPKASPAAQAVLAGVQQALSLDDPLAARRALDGAAAMTPQDQVLLHLCHSVLDDHAGIESGIAAAEQAFDIASRCNNDDLLALALNSKAWSLNQNGYYDEAIDIALQSAALAEAVGDESEQALAFFYAAISLSMIGRSEEAIEAAYQSAALAERVSNLRVQARGLRIAALNLAILNRHQTALQIAAKAISKFATTYKSEEGKIWLIVARLLGNLAATFAGGSPSAIAVIKSLLGTIAGEFGTSNLAERFCSGWLDGLADEVLRSNIDPQTLQDWGTAIRLYFGDDGNAIAQRFRVAADYHASGRAPASLARVDPDLATALRTMFPPK